MLQKVVLIIVIIGLRLAGEPIIFCGLVPLEHHFVSFQLALLKEFLKLEDSVRVVFLLGSRPIDLKGFLTCVDRVLLAITAVADCDQHLGFDCVQSPKQVTFRFPRFLGVKFLKFDSLLLKLYIFLHRPAASLP